MFKQATEDSRELNFSVFAQTLLNAFPGVDIRLSRTEVDGEIRFLIPEVMDSPRTVRTSIEESEHLVHQAILDIKEILYCFDA